MALDKSNSGVSAKKSRAEQRVDAFIGSRTVSTVQKTTHGRSLDGGFEEGGTEAASPAEYRLQQLEQFREMQRFADAESGTGARDLGVAGQLNWASLGPKGAEKGQAETMPLVSGRAKGMAVAPGGQRVYVATANGGVWYSGDSGKNWQSLFDQENFYLQDPNLPADPLLPAIVSRADTLACGSIALVPGSGAGTDKIYVGTGEGDDSMDSFFGVGPMVSSDGGKSWVRELATPSLVGQGIYAIVVDPDDPQRAVAATSIGIFVRVPDGAGFKWEQKGPAATHRKITGLTVAKGATVKRYYAAVMGRTVYTSDDGDTWGLAGTGFPTNRIGRMSIASHPATPELAYALVAFGDHTAASGPISDANAAKGQYHGVYRLDTRIDNVWREIKPGMPRNLFGPNRLEGGQGWYDNCIVVAPNNENRIFLGGSIANSGGAWSAAIYRCDVQVQTAAGTVTVTASNTYIGSSTHGDVHNLSITPGDPDQLWVSCDGGVYMTRQANTGTGHIFQSLNAGLQTFTMNHFGMHPDEEDSFFCSVQDNGCLRYVGEDFWLHSFGGDSGYCIINWKRRNEVMVTYTNNVISFSNKYGARPATHAYDDTNRDIPLQAATATVGAEQVQFYAPLVGIPFKTGLPDAHADMVAFGTNRPWISTNFGVNWFPLPSRQPGNQASYQSDATLLGNNFATPGAIVDGILVQSLAFADSKNLLVGTLAGGVFRYTDTSASNNWTTVANPTQLNVAVAGMPAAPVTDIVIHPTNAAHFYVVFGGANAGISRAWFYDGTWHDRSGTPPFNLLNVHFNTLVINPDNPAQLFAGCDLGVFKSDNNGTTWLPFTNGLPETVITDLHISSRTLTGGGKFTLLRVATYGRGVFECDISLGVANTPAAILYLRDNLLDRGRFTTRKDVFDPRNAAVKIPDLGTPDIKVDVPDATGKFQFAATEVLTPGQFSLSLTDKAAQIPVPASGGIVSRVYVQVHSRGMSPAYNVQVTLLIKELSLGVLPDLPTNYDPDIRAGIPINRNGWQTVGIRSVQGVQAGNSKVVAFDLPSGILPAHGTLGGAGKDLALVALLNCPQLDEYTATARVLNPATAGNVTALERKITVKVVKAVQSPAIPALVVRQPLAGYVAIPASATAPEAPYDAFLAQAFRLNDAVFNRLLLSRFAQPISNRGTDGVLTNPGAANVVFAETILVNADITLLPGVPLIWFARKKITISKTIIAKGMGAARAGDGDFGGAGGGGASSAGRKCSLPRSTPAFTIAIGGATGNNAGAPLDAAWASRALMQMPFCKGAGAGGDDGANLGGLGSGIVILCAPVIEFTPVGKIDATGSNGAGNAGGGGGGLVVLIAGEVINLNNAGPNQNVLLAGGTSSGSGGAGGLGILLRKTFQ